MNSLSSFITKTTYFFTNLIIFITILGFINSTLGLNFNLGVLYISLIISYLLTYYTYDKFELFEKVEIKYFLLLIIIIFFIYSNYSPILEIRQDPSLYTYRSMLLSNTGFDFVDYKLNEEFMHLMKIENSGYAKNLNGTQLVNGRLLLDFLPGPSYLMAIFSLISKKITFFSLTLIAILSSIITYLLFIKEFKSNLISFLLTISIFVSPLFTWFGRAPFSEMISYLSVLYLIYFLKVFLETYQENELLKYSIIFNIVFFFIYLLRIDLWLVIYLTVIFISFKDLKLSLILFLTTLFYQVLVFDSYTIYSNRINAGFFRGYLSYSHYFLFLLVIFANFISKKNLFIEKINKYIFRNHILKKIILGVSLIILFYIIFRDEFFTTNFQIREIHGKIMPTHNEHIFDNLSLLFPTILIIIGFMGLILSPFDKIFPNNMDKLFLIFLFFIFGIAFYELKNSPQLYWGYRRFIPVLIPSLVLGITYFDKNISFSVKKYFLFLILLISLLLQIKSNQIINIKYFENNDKYWILSDMKKLDYSLSKNKDWISKTQMPLIYEKKIKYMVSSLISYYSLKPIIAQDNVNLLEKSNLINTNHILASKEKLDLNNFKSKCENLNKPKIQFIRFGENYNKLPRDIYYKDYKDYNFYFCYK